MSKPEVHTFGVAKYVYASAYDKLEAERDKLRKTLDIAWDDARDSCVAKAREAREGGGAWTTHNNVNGDPVKYPPKTPGDGIDCEST
mgnify:CR=1 FL=1